MKNTSTFHVLWKWSIGESEKEKEKKGQRANALIFFFNFLTLAKNFRNHLNGLFFILGQDIEYGQITQYS